MVVEMKIFSEIYGLYKTKSQKMQLDDGVCPV